MTMFMRARMHLIKKLCLVGYISLLFLSTNAVNALNTGQADKLISSLVKDINTIINSQKPPTFMYLDFKSVLTKYADTKIMSQKVLGIDWRRAQSVNVKIFKKHLSIISAANMARDSESFWAGKLL